MSRVPEVWRAVQQLGVTKGITARVEEVIFKNPGKIEVYIIPGRPRRYVWKDEQLVALDDEHEGEVKIAEWQGKEEKNF